MKAKVVTATDSNGFDYDMLMFVCPGCVVTEGPGGTGLHMLTVNSETKSPSWTWNGDLEAPTLSPSILNKAPFRCHSFLEDGIFRFLKDSNHKFARQSIPMPDLPDWAAELSEDDESNEGDDDDAQDEPVLELY